VGVEQGLCGIAAIAGVFTLKALLL
jgi:hypothetical protein